MKYVGCLLFSMVGFWGISQENLTVDCREKVTLYSDFGFASAPIKLKFPLSDEVDKLNIRNNFSPSIGLGFAYKWLNLRLNIALNNTQRAKSRFGNTRYFDLGVNFQIKQVYSELSITGYNGYAIQDAYVWNDTLNALRPNLIQPQFATFAITANTWYFRQKDFKMAAVYGRQSYFSAPTETWYFKPTAALHGFGNGGKPLIPGQFQDSLDGRTLANNLAAFEVGMVPGFAKIWKYRNWQLAGFTGLGGVIQLKSYSHGATTRAFLGLAPRIDLRAVAGYYCDRYFVCLASEFDNRSIRFLDYRIRQLHYSLRLTAGYRLNRKEQSKPKK